MKVIFIQLFVYFIYFCCQVSGRSLPELINDHIDDYRHRNLTEFQSGFVLPSDIVFTLWTALGKSQVIAEGKLDNVDINPASPFKIITHGFQSTGKAKWIRQITEKYLKKGTCNVIVVNWGDLANSWFYPEASGYTKGVGEILAYLIIDLHKTKKVPLEDFHLIGHSLGAHVSGFAGSYVYEYLGNKLGRISGLDPAGPLFLNVDPNGRLGSEDAAFVDIIHTDSKKYGLAKPIGHVDFFPNGGRGPQPGCSFYLGDIYFYVYDRCIEAFNRGKDPNFLMSGVHGTLCSLSALLTAIRNFNDAESVSNGAKKIVTCSHTRSHQLWEESINSGKLLANECSDIQKYDMGLCENNKIAIMGEMVDKSTTGTYFLSTNAKPPYARNGLI